MGHFTDFGGTSITENNWSLRLKNFSSSIWADGFGGYLIGRHWLTLILSTLFFFTLMLSAKNIIRDFRNNDVTKLLFYSLIIYSIWILFFQNVIYKSRHVIPIVIVLLYLLAVGNGTSFWKNRASYIFSSLYIIFSILYTTCTTFANLLDMFGSERFLALKSSSLNPGNGCAPNQSEPAEPRSFKFEFNSMIQWVPYRPFFGNTYVF